MKILIIIAVLLSIIVFLKWTFGEYNENVDSRNIIMISKEDIIPQEQQDIAELKERISVLEAKMSLLQRIGPER